MCFGLVSCAHRATASSSPSPQGQRAHPKIRKPVVKSSRLFSPLMRNLPQRTPILTYHDCVAVRDAQALWFDVTPKELSEQLDWLAMRGAHFISIQALYDHLVLDYPIPIGAVCITFADNYEGFYVRALPILKRRHVPVAMFVHTGFVGDRSHGRPKMTWDQLEKLDKGALVTICSQTVTHPPDLRKLGPAALAKEMAESRADLEAHFGRPVLFLAYPNGVHDARIEAAARAAGYLAAFTEGMRPAETSRSILSIDRYVHTKYRKAWQDARRK